MEKHLNTLYQTRRNFIALLDQYSEEQLNTIPAGFNNNLIWNFGHIVVSQQIICFTPANQTPLLQEHEIAKYRKGTKPEEMISMEEYRYYKSQALACLDHLFECYRNGIFDSYNPLSLHYGITLNNIHDAIHFVGVHDALHYGYARAICRLV